MRGRRRKRDGDTHVCWLAQKYKGLKDRVKDRIKERQKEIKKERGRISKAERDRRQTKRERQTQRG